MKELKTALIVVQWWFRTEQLDIAFGNKKGNIKHR